MLAEVKASSAGQLVQVTPVSVQAACARPRVSEMNDGPLADSRFI